MDTNKKFENLLTEGSHSLTSNVKLGLPDDDEAVMLDKLNSVVGHIASTPSINPYYAIERIKKFLNMAFDLTFNDCYLSGDVGTVSEPLYSRTNGMYAKEFNNKEVHDNGFLKPFPYGLKVIFSFLRMKGLYTVHADIQKNNPPQQAFVAEEK